MTIARPSFSLIVNTTDRANSLRTLLRSLEHQSYPYFEVVVVVGPTKDHTLDILAEYEDRLRILHCPKPNLSQSRNLGLLAAQGDIVAYIDDDAVPSRNWLEQLARLFADSHLDATGGKVYLVHPDQPTIQHRIGIVSSLGEQVDVRDSWLSDIVPPGKGYQWVGRMMGTNMAFRRRALLDIGGFDQFYEWLYDDTDVSIRLVNAGKIVHPVTEAVVYHVPASSRNRVARSFNAKWWIQTKSVIYFSIKNGPLAGNSRRSVLLRCLHFVHGHWLWSKQLHQQKRLSYPQLWRMRTAEVNSALMGAASGLSQPRKLISKPSGTAMSDSEAPLKQFQNRESVRQPTVDPVTGYRPMISMPEPPLRICLLSSAYPPHEYEGVGRLTNLMAQGLFECGHTVHVITRGEKDEVSFYDGAYVHRIASGMDRYERYRLFPKLFNTLNHSHTVHEKVKQLILNDGIQIVDSPLWMTDGIVTAMSQTIPVVARLLTALRQVADLQQDRDADTYLVGELERSLIEKAAHLFPNTKATLEAVKKAYQIPISADRYTFAPYGIVPASEEAIRPFSLDSEPKEMTVLYVGRLEKRKGVMDLFQAIPTVLTQFPTARFIIAGADNSHRDGFYAREGMDYPSYFQKQYPSYQDRVAFKGAVSDELLHRLYQSCDLFVAPSLYESFGLIYLEAMNYAKPVIGCRAGGIPEVIDHNEIGLLVEPGASAALAEAILTLLRSPQKLRDMGLAGRAQLMEKFTYVQMARNFAQAYRQVIHNFKATDEENLSPLSALKERME